MAQAQVQAQVETLEQKLARLEQENAQLRERASAMEKPGEPTLKLSANNNGYVSLIVPNVGSFAAGPAMARWLASQGLKPFAGLTSATLDKLQAAHTAWVAAGKPKVERKAK